MALVGARGKVLLC